MLWFGTPGGDRFSLDYIGSVACFDSDGQMLALSKVNPLELEQDDFRPLTVAELMTMVGTGNIDPMRFHEWKGAPILWNCWTILVDHPEPVVLANLIAAAYSQLIALEKFAEYLPSDDDVEDIDDETEPFIVADEEDEEEDEDYGLDLPKSF